MAQAKKQVDRHENDLRSFAAQHAGNLPTQTGVNLAALNRLNDQLRLNGEPQLNVMEQRQRLLEGVTLELQAAMVTPNTPVQLGDPLEIPRRIERMKDELQQLLTKATPQHPDVIKLKDQLATLEREQATREQKEAAAQTAEKAPEPSKDLPPARKRALEKLDGELDRLKKTEADVRVQITTFEKRLEGVPELSQEFTLLNRDQVAAKEYYDSLSKKYEEARMVATIESDRQGERFRILESALPPEGPKAPNRPRLFLLGLLLAAAAAVGAVLFAEQMDTSFHSLDEVRKFTNVPVIAAIPRIDGATVRQRARFAVALASGLLVIGLAGALSAHMAKGNEQLVRFFVRTS
jgi:uncharacterized protein involved in exopolysaccharide biosynthesis